MVVLDLRLVCTSINDEGVTTRDDDDDDEGRPSGAEKRVRRGDSSFGAAIDSSLSEEVVTEGVTIAKPRGAATRTEDLEELLSSTTGEISDALSAIISLAVVLGKPASTLVDSAVFTMVDLSVALDC